MFNQEQLSGGQATIFITAAAIGTIFLGVPSIVVESAGRDGWLSIPIGYTIGILIGLCLVRLGQRFPNKTLVQYLPDILGTVLGKTIGLIYIVSFFLLSSSLIREYNEVMLLLMPETPPIAFNILLIFLVAYVVKAGLEVFARVCQFFVPYVVFGILFVLFSSQSFFDANNLKPFLENGITPVLKTVPMQIAFAGEAVLFMALWLPCLIEIQKGNRATIIGISIAGVLLTLVVIVTVGVLGPERVLDSTFALFSLSRLILVGDFLRGFEGILTIIWIPAAFMKVTIFFYPGVVGLAQWFNLKEYKPLVLPLAVIAVGMSMVPENLEQLKQFTFINELYFISSLTLMIPLLWIIAILRRLKS
ncbi:spore germination protein KB [Desulfitispora alkaliphila]|uniref:GerAB/ArcD/ProY family transporter n=1 Tax=Desulfitispora alkaliphila TaxID=622674 RepID=UPI003D1FF7E8